MMVSSPRRALGWCAALAAGVLLLTPSDSQAQMFRGGRGYGGYRNGWGGGWGYGSPGYNYGYGGRYGSYYSPGYGYSSYPGYGYSSPGYTYYGTTPYAYNYPYTNQGSVVTPTYTAPQVATGPSTVTESLYRAATPSNAARLTVLLPAADAQVWVQNTPMTETGGTREFVSPSLTPGENYTYEVRATWNQGGQPMDRTRSVRVRANEISVADFRTPQGSGLPSTPAATTPPPPLP